MAASLRTSHQIHTLANDLGAKIVSNPVDAIVHYCDKKVENLMSGYPD
jgi:hypothetical protein